MSKFRLAIDMHGGDGGVAGLCRAVMVASEKLGEKVEFILCGNEKEIKCEFTKIDSEFERKFSERFSFCESNATDSIKSNVSRFWRTNSNSSLVKCVSLQKDKQVNASLSAGDTGAFYASAFFLLGREPKIDRAALAITIPTISEKSAVLLDIGANAECTAKHLFQFAVLGEKYCRKVLKHNELPKIGLLNIGSEAYKGTNAVKDAAVMIQKEFGEQFAGFVEGNEIFDGNIDVVVCDGFSGNAILKTSESLYNFIKTKIGNLLPPEAIKQMQQFNAESYGSSQILGINGNVFKAHGNSTVEALSCAIIKAVDSSI
jgi:glycerol-3-phosphate acyltransferase PlsX